jgi:hypothetical protein
MNTDLQQLRSCTDGHTRMIIDDAIEILGFVRGYRGPFLDDPVVRLHLLSSLHHQIQNDLVTTCGDACELGYSTTELLTILTPIPPRHDR